MPNRIIKESICYSDDLDQLSAFEENVFIRLLVRVDDFGRIDARPSFLKNTLFVTKKGVTEKNVEDALLKLASLGLVRVYEVDQKPFLVLPTWEKHQTIRAKKSKYPAPQAKNINPQASEIICKQMQTNASKCSRNPIQSNPIQSESESESNPILSAQSADCTEQADKRETEKSVSLVVETLPLKDNTLFSITQDMVDEWRTAFQAVNVQTELRKMRAWLNANPSRGKSKAGILRFCNSWLSRAQDSSVSIGSQRASPSKLNAPINPDHYEGTRQTEFEKMAFEAMKREEKLRAGAS